MTIQQLKTKLKTQPTEITFAETMQLIDENYTFTPTAFTNGNIKNNLGENSGSCKLFSFAIHEQLTKEETLLCFAEHYSTVLKEKNGGSHQNIRSFIQTGFDGLSFENKALKLK
ncbi:MULTISPECIES: HopJ type III effector protein [unclassified Polaribacter]|uniref:HopJ type III effector protein n=1 Tax=unclassified Polaribacter TaxID=196858 RepID=UPI0011BE4364|nr:MULTISPECIES: HopJ type III effector protein [unclassified Polaribacter]TXD50171.1 HopJ type III effector protein [Polaribacter sp. IC063]TXD56237.1 HopJ type III effector protein [Polaribacter sp. IC066]